MAKELQIFLLWNNARKEEKRILNDIKQKYELLRIFEISWPEKSFPDNFTRFYNKNMRGGYRKTWECGRGKFLLVVCWDNSPVYKLNPRRGYKINDNAICNKTAIVSGRAAAFWYTPAITSPKLMKTSC